MLSRYCSTSILAPGRAAPEEVDKTIHLVAPRVNWSTKYNEGAEQRDSKRNLCNPAGDKYNFEPGCARSWCHGFLHCVSLNISRIQGNSNEFKKEASR